MADAYLALFGHDLDGASDEARAGALLLAEHHCYLNAFVKGLAEGLSGKKSPSPNRSKIRR